MLSFVMIFSVFTIIPVPVQAAEVCTDILTVDDTGATRTNYVNCTARNREDHPTIGSAVDCNSFVYNGGSFKAENGLDGFVYSRGESVTLSWTNESDSIHVGQYGCWVQEDVNTMRFDGVNMTLLKAFVDQDGNKSAGNVGGIYWHKNISGNKLVISGSVRVTGNSNSDGSANNVYLPGSQVFINVTGTLSSDTLIGVSTPVPEKTITSGLSGKGSVDNFRSDSESWMIGAASSGEAILKKPYVIRFDANGGSGEMEDIVTLDSPVTMPECTFTAPEGKRFKAWSDGYGNTIEEDEEVGLTPGIYEYTITAVWADVYTITVADSTGGTITVTVTPDDGCVLNSIDAYYYGEYHTLSGNAFTMPADDVTVYVNCLVGTPYIDGDGEEKLAAAYTFGMPSNVNSLWDHWYAVDEDIEFDHDVEIRGNVNLILCDGATLSFTKKEDDSDCGRFVFKGNSSLTIYGQSEGTGKFTCADNVGYMSIYSEPTDDYGHGVLTMNGGALEAKTFGQIIVDEVNINRGTVKNFCVYARGDITVNGGTIDHDVYSTGISSDEKDVRITGGDLYLRTTGASDAGIRAENNVTITGGRIVIPETEGRGIYIHGESGQISLSWTILSDSYDISTFERWSKDVNRVVGSDVIINRCFNCDNDGNTEETYTKLAALVTAMLNYGGAAQIQFEDQHQNDECGMANDGLAAPAPLTQAELSAIDTQIPDKDAINAELDGTGLTFYGYTMLLHTKTALRFYFLKDSPDTDISGIRLSFGTGDDTVTCDAQNYNERYAYVEAEDIPAYELNNAYTLTVNGKDLGSYSALSYVRYVLTDETAYRYHEVAVAYFPMNNG